MSNIPLPKMIGPYEVRGVLGRGGMATVYRAYQPSLRREVAIKLMANSLVNDATFLERFEREAQVIASLRHPNILVIYDYGRDNDTPYIVSELLSGETLRNRLGRPLPPKEVVSIVKQIASALDYGAKRGIVHRDVKPTNILMDDERPVLADFGIVKLMSSSAANLTATGFGVGTPEYMSPEQATSDPLDGRSDQYSLAVVVYEMLTGVTPFRGDTPIAILMNHVNRPLPDPRQYNTAISPAVIEVLTKALAKKRDDRYPTSTAFADAFEQAVNAVAPNTQRYDGGVGYNTNPDQTHLAVPQQNDPFAPTTYRPNNQPTQVTPNNGYTPLPPVYQNNPPTNNPAPPNNNQRFTPPPPVNNQPPYYQNNFGPNTPPPVPPKSRTGLIVGSLVGLVVLIAAIVLAVVLLTGKKDDTNATGSATATPSTGPNTTAPVTTALTTGTPGTTTMPVTSSPGQPTTTVPATTRPVTTAPATTNTGTTCDPAEAQVKAITDKLYVGKTADFKQTADALRQLIKDQPNSWLANRELGFMLYLWNNEAGEVDALKRAVALNPNDAISHAYLSSVYIDNYNYDASLNEALTATRLAPDNGTTQAALALIQNTNKQTKEAAASAEKALQLDPEGMWPLWAAANASDKPGFTRIEYLDKLISKYPNFATFYSAKGSIYYYVIADNDRAKTTLNKALEIDNRYPYALSSLGYIARGEGRYDDAINFFQRSVAANDSYARGHSGFGYALNSKGRNDEALDQFKRAIEIDVRNDEAYNGVAFITIDKANKFTDANAKADGMREGIRNTDLAIKYNAGYADAYYHKGRAYYYLKDYGNAQPALEKAVEISPKRTTYRNFLGYTYFNLKLYDKAQEQVNEILKIDPKYDDALKLQEQLKAVK